MKSTIAIALVLFAIVVVVGSAIYLISDRSAVTVEIKGAARFVNYEGTNVPAYTFSPARIEVRKETIVNWINEDTITAYTITGPGLFASQLIQPQGKFSFKFDNVGTYGYHCNLHPWMNGEIVVTD